MVRSLPLIAIAGMLTAGPLAAQVAPSERKTAPGDAAPPQAPATSDADQPNGPASGAVTRRPPSATPDSAAPAAPASDPAAQTPAPASESAAKTGRRDKRSR